MKTNRTVHPLLVQAYRQAIYIVNEHEHTNSLKVGEVNYSLASLMKFHEVSTAALLTAYNPYSELRSIDENEAAQAELIKALANQSKACMNAIGTDEIGQWDPEPSILALGISLQEAERLADEYGQNAFIWFNNSDALVSLRLRFDIGIPSIEERAVWIQSLQPNLQEYANSLTPHEQALIMSTPTTEQAHWLNTTAWDLNARWPLARPDGTAMGIGTEMDRMFKLIAAGIQKVY